ncbi:MAG: hypothetical protein IT299_04120 [Dehalococcoidia bacterium]|nr:hypothetical protein [Dehalococcoidia bacterium]
MGSTTAARWWMAGSGVAMVALGILARLDTTVAGTAPDALLRMNAMHGTVHALGGVLTIGAAAALNPRWLAVATFGYGAIFVFAFASNLASPDFFGMMPEAPANLGVHVMHATVAIASLALGALALRQSGGRASYVASPTSPTAAR